ncbi:MAG TPA: TfuA-like protein [Nitrososphaeraceae archaeon]|jgi:TfuA protein|nr:TfuA-like protein [Nitrososphaeraceae archaeon]
MSKPIIFIGPSLSPEKARRILEADYRPPAKKGDLLRLAGLETVVNIVGLVDGLFLQDYPPTPIEVYQLAIKKNMVLVGGASLGALRAVELEKFGMVGIGKIFELYKKGKIHADDEVAVTFSEDRQVLQSEAMIDIRFNLFLAQRKKIIDEVTKRTIAKVAKSTYFPYRNYGDIIDQSKKLYPELTSQLEAFRSYIYVYRQSLKERDAIRLIRYIKELSSNQQHNNDNSIL